jgi:hypothetical protein
MSIAAKDGTGADITLASAATAAGEVPVSTPGDPVTGAPFKASSEATLEAARVLLQALLDRTPTALGQQPASQATPVALSAEDADQLAQLIERLGVLQTARNADGSLRVTLLGGTVATVATVGAVTTVTTVTTVGTVSNQTNIGGYTAAPHIPALMNMTAESNINRMVG